MRVREIADDFWRSDTRTHVRRAHARARCEMHFNGGK